VSQRAIFSSTTACRANIATCSDPQSGSFGQIVASAAAWQATGDTETASARGSDDDEGDADSDDRFDPYVFIGSMTEPHPLPPPTCLPPPTRSSRSHTLVLDLDETLVHSELVTEGWAADGGLGPMAGRGPGSSLAHDAPPPCFSVSVDLGPAAGPDRCPVFAVWRRPGLDAFLQRAAALFEVVVFTASQRPYADRLLDTLDPGRRLVRHRIFREGCTLSGGAYVKDLRGLRRDLGRTLLVDNSPQAFALQLGNGVPIDSFLGSPDDTELETLMPFLERATRASDVRALVRDEFRLHERVAAACRGEGGRSM